MDFATIIGLLSGTFILVWAITLGGDIGIFFNFPAFLIVFGCCVATAFIRFGMKDVVNSTKVAANAFITRLENPHGLIADLVDLAVMARKNGLLILEQQPVKDRFLRKAIMYCVDGHEPAFIEEVLKKEIRLTIERHELGKRVFVSMGDAAPAFGMIGTLVGLVQMFSSMSEPSTIGAAMAVAFLTTLYGAVLANLVMLPIADKLALRCQEEEQRKMLIIEGVLGILRGLNPRIMEEVLQSFLPPRERRDIYGGL